MKLKIFYTLLVICCTLGRSHAQIPSGYYDNATGTGFALKSQLHDIIDGHSNQGYGALWTFYSNYELDNYYENDGTILDIYSENPDGADPYNYTKGTDQCGNYSGEGSCYNREHSFPRAWFGGDVEPMNSDVHHIFASDGAVNGTRGSYPYGEVSSASSTSQNGSKVGSGTSEQGYTGTVFEPIDEFKGDLARAHFYMATRYEDLISGWESNSSEGANILDGSSDKVFEDWAIDLLIKWHEQDPVSQKELDRNDNAYYNHQGNRNPFVDHPEWVGEIWGEETQETTDDISDVIDGANGSEYTIEGIVTTPDYGGSNGQYFVQDESAGINVFHSSNHGLVSMGDLVQITGVRAVFNSIIEIEPSSVTVLSGNETLPDHAEIFEGDLQLGSDLEGSLVEISGVTLDDDSQWPISDSGSGANVDVTIGSTSFVIRIDDASYYYGTSVPDGELVVRGVLSRYNDDLQIFPFVEGDIEEIPDAVPSLSVSKQSIVFQTTEIGGFDNGSFTVSGADLSEDVSISVSGDFQVSTSENSGFASSLVLTVSDMTLENTEVFVQFTPSAEGTRTTTLSISSSGEDESISLEGEGFLPTTLGSAAQDLIKIYPNPVNGILKIENLSSGHAVRIFDHLGRRMGVKKIDEGIDVSDFESGQYFLTISTDPPRVFKFLVN